MESKSHLILKELLKYARSTPSDIVLPNWYVGNWEFDVFKLSKAGYITEYEVKVSRADFLNDFTKETNRRYNQEYEKRGLEKPFESLRKHECLIGRCHQFYFVVPAGMVDKSEVSDNCGLIYFEKGRLSVVKVAPKISKEKILFNWEAFARKVYYRCDNLRHKNFLLRKKHGK